LHRTESLLTGALQSSLQSARKKKKNAAGTDLYLRSDSDARNFSSVSAPNADLRYAVLGKTVGSDDDANYVCPDWGNVWLA